MQQLPTSPDQPARTTSWYTLGGVLLVCILIRLLSQAFASEPPAKPEAPPLELPAMRLTEGRLSGQTIWVPYPTFPTNGREYLHALRQKLSSPQDRAIYHLLKNDIDQAVADMEEAVRTKPGEASLLSDLSALYGERAHRKNQPEDFVASLEMAERAASLGTNAAGACFNHGLALEHLFLYEKAFDCWREWIHEIDWDREILKHRHRLMVENSKVTDKSSPPLRKRIAEGGEEGTNALIAANPQEAREVFMGTLLFQWAEAWSNGQQKQAYLRLTRARQVAEVLARRNGNRIFLSVVGEMERVSRGTAGQRATETLVQSLRSYKLGRNELNAGRLDEALKALVMAERGFHSIGSPVEVFVSLSKAYCQIRQNDRTGARATLVRLGEDPRMSDSPFLDAWRQIDLADLAKKSQDLNEALGFLRRSLDLFQALGEMPNVAHTQNEIASVLEALGQTAEAWRYRYQALAWTRRLPGKSQDFFYADRGHLSIALDLFEGAAQAALAQRRPEAALQFQARAVALARANAFPESTALALLTRARIEAVLGRQETARRDFLGALNILPPGKNWASDLLAARIDVVRSEIANAENRAAAIASERFVPEDLDQKADFDFRHGDTEAGEKSLQRALDELEHRRTKITPGGYRVSFFDQARPLYERLVALEAHRAQPEKALEVLERFRARTLLDQMGQIPGLEVSPAPLRWPDLRRLLPEHTVLPVYAVVDDRLVTILIQRSGAWISPDQPSWPMIVSWAQRLSDPQVDEQERRELLEQLHGVLVAPWKSRIGKGDRIIFVPTGNLFQVPFAALLDRISSRFLIEDHAVGVAPSASQFIAAVQRDLRISAKPLTSVLLIGNPTRSHSNDWLSPTPGAAKEIQLLSQLYAHEAQELTGSQATPRRVLSLLGGADIGHFAVHALSDSKDPMRSHLFLSPSGNDSGELSVRDLLRVHLPRTRLVVLAACGSQAGFVSESEGSLSLSYSFLTAGVPAVVGSLWFVDDASTSRLSVRFHQELLRGADALTALRTAQIKEIAASRPLSNWTWASFQVYGGVAERTP